MRRHRPRRRPPPLERELPVTMPQGGARAVDLMPAAIVRGVGFLCLWLVIFRIDLAAVLVGAATAAAASWTSLRLLPPGTARLRPLRSPGSWCASSRSPWSPESTWRGARSIPACRCGPGFVLCPTRLVPGPARDAFCTMASLLPGTLPAGSDQRRIARALPRCRSGRAGADGRGGGNVSRRAGRERGDG